MIKNKFKANLDKRIKAKTEQKSFPAIVVGASPTRTGYTVVELFNGQEIEVFNPAVPNTAGLNVTVGYDQYNPSLLVIYGTRQTLGDAINYVLPEHNTTHQYPSYDVLWVQREQFLGGVLVLPIGETSPFSVQVYGEVTYVGSTWEKVSNQVIDLTSYLPTDGAIWVMLQSNSSGAITIKTSDAVSGKELLTTSNLPTPDVDCRPIVGIQMYAGQTQLNRDPTPGKINDFYDLRFSGYATSVGSSAMNAIDGAPQIPAIADLDEFGIYQVSSGLFKKITWADLRPPVYIPQITRWVSTGGTTFDYPDEVDRIINVSINGVIEDALLYTLNGTQLVFDSATLIGDIIQSEYIVRTL